MARQTWVGPEVVQSVAGTNFGAYTTAVTVLTPTALRTIRANSLKIGDAFRVTVYGSLSNIATAPGTVVFQIMIGSSIAFTTGTIQLNDTVHADLPFRLEVLLTVRAIGNSTNANMMGMGVISGTMFTVTADQVDGVNSQTILHVPATTPAVGAGFNSTIDNVLDFWCGFSINNAENNVAIEQYIVESL